MIHSTRLLIIMATFLVPNSQAIISSHPSSMEQSNGYHCETGTKAIKVSIHYGNEEDSTGCKVILERNKSETISLLEAKRNLSICEDKIEGMKQRLVDRGWYCRAYDP